MKAKVSITFDFDFDEYSAYVELDFLQPKTLELMQQTIALDFAQNLTNSPGISNLKVEATPQ